MSNDSRERDRIELLSTSNQQQIIDPNDSSTIKQLYTATMNGNLSLMKSLIINKVNPLDVHSLDIIELYQLSSLSSVDKDILPQHNSLFFASIISNSIPIIDYVVDYLTPHQLQQSLLQQKQHQTQSINNDNDEIIQFAMIIGFITNHFNSIQHLSTKYNIKVDDNTMMKYLPYILQQCNIKVLQYLIQQYNIIRFFNTTTYPNNGLFHNVVKSGNIELVKYVIELGDIIDNINELHEPPSPYPLSSPPLHVAATNFHWDIVRFLIEKGASFELLACFSRYSQSLLHYAVCDINVSTEFIDYLINDLGIDVETSTEDGTTPALHAASAGNIRILKYLVEHYDADINQIGMEGNSIFYYAACARDQCTPELISYIHSRGVDIDDTDWVDYMVPIQFAIEYCNADVVQEFINCGARLIIRCETTVFIYQNHQMSIVELDEENYRHIVLDLFRHHDVPPHLYKNYFQNDTKNTTGYEFAMDFELLRTDWKYSLELGVDTMEEAINIHGIDEICHLLVDLISCRITFTSNWGPFTQLSRNENDDPKVAELVMGYFFNRFSPTFTQDHINRMIVRICKHAFRYNNRKVIEFIFENYYTNGQRPLAPTIIKILANLNERNIDTLSYLLNLKMVVMNEFTRAYFYQNSYYNTTSASILCAAVRYSTISLQAIQLLIQHGANINSIGENGFNVIHFLVHPTPSPQSDKYDNRRCEILRYLLDSGANITTISKKSQTVLHLASVESSQCVSMLIGHFIDQLLLDE